jgi:hypothetical protein
VTDGKITDADHSETFTASHVIWERKRYERQWREAADRVLDGRPACFVVDVASAHSEYRGECWSVWPDRDVAVVQNQLLLGSKFDPDDPYAFLPAVPHRITGDGRRISTWRTNLADVAAWQHIST